jgi:thymidylate kinase
LTVLLDAPLEALLARIRTRGRPGEDLLTIEHLGRIENALEDRVAAADEPVLRLDASDQKAAIVELTAALEAMR